MNQFIRKWLTSTTDRVGLDILLGQAPEPTSALKTRLAWISQLVHWVRQMGANAHELGSDSSRIQVTRLRHILLVLDRNPELKKKCSQTLRSIISDTRALEMFLSVGIPNQQGFFEEIFERLQRRFVPQAIQENDLIHIFSETFRFESDAEWVGQMDKPLFQEWLDLFHFGEEQVDHSWNSLIQDARDALFLLTLSVRAIGLSPLVRNRTRVEHFSKLPFYSLMDPVSALLSTK